MPCSRLHRPWHRADVAPVQVGYLRWLDQHPTISLLDKPAPDNGLAGAKLAMADNNTTGRFMNQQFELVDAPVRMGEDAASQFAGLTERGITLILSDCPADVLLKMAEAGRPKGITLFNIGAPDDLLRQADCRDNVIHVAPSRAMLADDLLRSVWKKWSRWVSVYGSHPEDALLADAYRRAAQRFGARIVQEREFKDSGGARQTDSGVVQTQQQMPVFTQGLPDYDVLVTADENAVFAGYLPFALGTRGQSLVLLDCGRSVGIRQVNGRHTASGSLYPFGASAHVRTGHAGMDRMPYDRGTASRTNSIDPAKIVQDMKGPDFGIAAYKGQKLSLRSWDWQLRQPILLSDGRTVVSVSPQPGFLHQVTELDTLGFDRPETKCKL